MQRLDARAEGGQGKSLVIGGSGLVGGYIVEHLIRRGADVLAVSRSARDSAGVEWLRADLQSPKR
jgi:uncharacterized protein YbjT (DUF2867 family)